VGGSQKVFDDGRADRCGVAQTPKLTRTLRTETMATLKIAKSDTVGLQPPRPLGKAGARLWKTVVGEYDLADAGGIELLCLACQALDRAEACRAQIDRDGEMVKTKVGWKEHCLLKAELANRAYVSRAISRLGIDGEAAKPVGRPGIKSWPQVV
jgi:hypothetical protein